MTKKTKLSKDELDEIRINYTDAELEKQWSEKVLNSDEVRKELQGHLNNWLHSYEHFLQLHENSKRTYYISMIAMTEVFLHNQLLAFQSLGVEVQFDELDDYLKYKPLMSPMDVLDHNKLSYGVVHRINDENKIQTLILNDDEIRRNQNIHAQSVFDREQRANIKDEVSIERGTSATYEWPSLELIDIKITQDEVNELNDKCLEGVYKKVIEHDSFGVPKAVERWQPYEIKGKDKDLINALNYSRYQTRWFEEKYKRFNKTRDQHFTFIAGLLKKKRMVSAIELISWMIVAKVRYDTQRVHPHLLQKIINSFTDWYGKKYLHNGWNLEFGKRGNETIMFITDENYQASQPDERTIHDKYRKRLTHPKSNLDDIK